MEGDEGRLRMAVIAGAAAAARFKEKNPRALEQEVIQHVSDSVEGIIEKIDNLL